VFLTLLQSQGGPVPPPVPSGGGGPGTAASRRTRGWMRERAMLEASLEQFEQEHMRRIARTMADSEEPQANRIARKLADYDGELDQIQSLQRELGKLEAAQRSRITTAQRDADLQAAAAELREILRDDEDTIEALAAVDDLNSRAVFAVLGVTLH
jgi:hypothetical protein